jgi:hypothetical protein
LARGMSKINQELGVVGPSFPPAFAAADALRAWHLGLCLAQSYAEVREGKEF